MVKCCRSVGEKPCRLCPDTQAMPLVFYAAFAHINKVARLFLHSAIELPHPWTKVKNFYFSHPPTLMRGPVEAPASPQGSVFLPSRAIKYKSNYP